eukprot:COSAG03_NODE_27396_length_253_cov_0.974026_1_plen_32_part_01
MQAITNEYDANRAAAMASARPELWQYSQHTGG